uniref:Uncharacterized protein n=1 Tax=Tetranychus urticae TaxID=32264 RepID=T1KA34_TETUR
MYDRTARQYNILLLAGASDEMIIVRVFNSYFEQITERSMEHDYLIKFDLIYPETQTDIWIDGNGLLRIDWAANRYNLLPQASKYLRKIRKLFDYENSCLGVREKTYYVDPNSPENFIGGTVLDGHDKYALEGDNVFLSINTSLSEIESFDLLNNSNKNFRATSFLENLYILHSNLQLSKLTYGSGRAQQSNIAKIGNNISYDNCHITCTKANLVFLFHAITGEIFALDTTRKEWDSLGNLLLADNPSEGISFVSGLFTKNRIELIE